MKGFNKIEIAYKCDLKENQLQDVFKNWEEKPKPYKLSSWAKEWESGYFLTKQVSANHVHLERKIKSKGLDAHVEVQYYPELQALKVNVSTRYSALPYLLLPFVVAVICWEEIFAFEKNGFGYLLGILSVFVLFLLLVYFVSSSEKAEIQKDIEEQLHYARISYERQA